jgi:CrcB protein
MIPLLVFLGAGAGGAARYAIGGLVQNAASSTFPSGTLFVNLSGSMLLTFLYGLLENMAAPPHWRALLGIGFCGGYTTFSTFSYEAVRMLQEGEWTRASAYMLSSALGCVLAALLGFRLAALALNRG